MDYTRFVGFWKGLARELTSPCYVGHPVLSSPENKQFDPGMLGAKQYTATWDTGSTGTVITQRVIDELGLQPIGFTQAHTVGGDVKDVPVFLLSVILTNQVCIPCIKAIKGEIYGQSELLIGMDIITLGDFAVINKNSKTILLFQAPSLGKIDSYDVLMRDENSPPSNPKPITAKPRQSRNSPCHCDSGRKYKLCCMKKDQAS